MITVLVMTDGRLDCLRQSLPSLQTYLHGPVTRWIVHDDTGDQQYHQLLDYHTGPAWELVTTDARSGFGGAYRHAYDWWLANDTNDYLWSHEDDFVLTRPVDLAAMVQVLAAHDYLTQLALRRQPWNPVEKAAGGIVESRPHDYTERHDVDGHAWLEHRLFHTTNPSLVPRRLLEAHRWPTGPRSEGMFSRDVFDCHAEARAAYWGDRASGEWCKHVGHERVGRGY